MEDDGAAELSLLGDVRVDGVDEAEALAGDDAGADVGSGTGIGLDGFDGAALGCAGGGEDFDDGVGAVRVGDVDFEGLRVSAVGGAWDAQDEALGGGGGGGGLRWRWGGLGFGLGLRWGRGYLLAEGEGGGAGAADEDEAQGGGDEAGGASELDGTVGQVHDSPLEILEGVGIEDSDGVGGGGVRALRKLRGET